MHLEKHVALWHKIQQGNREALFELYDDVYFHLVRYGVTVYSDSDLVKDCVSQLFLKLWDKHHTLNDVENVQSYLFTALRRLIQDYLSAEIRASSSLRSFITEDEAEEASYEDIIIAREKDEEIRRDLGAALKELSPKQVELIRLKFFENMSYQEIALVSSQSVKTSYNTIYDAIKVLRLRLKM